MHCPVTFKKLTDNVQIVAIKETGNVYSYDAYKELNKDAKNYRDLLTDEKFDPNDSVFVINDPAIPILFRRNKQILEQDQASVELSGTSKRIMKSFEKL